MKKDSMGKLLIDDYAHFSSKVEDSYRKKEDSLGVVIDSTEKTFKGPFNGYAIIHNYRAKNALGMLIKTSTLFTFDKGLTKIVKADNND